MNAFRFEMESVLRFKRQLERIAEMKVLRAAAAVRDAQRRLDQLNERLSHLADEMQYASPGGDSTSSWQFRFEFAGKISRAVEEARKALAVAIQAERLANQERTAMAAEVEALLTLRRSRWEEHQKDVARAQQIQLDEVSLRGWSEQRRPLENEEHDS